MTRLRSLATQVLGKQGQAHERVGQMVHYLVAHQRVVRNASLNRLSTIQPQQIIPYVLGMQAP
jgi:hypothetical protein